jgi:N-ethylmaleimide reductase
MTTLFDPLRAGALQLGNRIVMAPLTRQRAGAGLVPTALTTEYYRQRASAGLIVTEASQICPAGQGYCDTPGIYSREQVAAWRRVTDAVHAAGGQVVIQLWHVGRISHVTLQPGGAAPVSSTARTAVAKTRIAEGLVEVSAPRALRTDELPGLVEDYRHAARSAMDAGFDGVEVHSANGYLLDQFLRDSINDRSDAYGGSIANRARLLVEVMRAVASEIGGDRTAVRISPVTPSNGAGQDSDPQALHEYVAAQIAPLGLAYLHVIEGATGGARDTPLFDYAALKASYRRGNPGLAWMVNNSYTREMALTAVASGAADLVAFGRPFISNPDLVRRLREDLPLTDLDRDTIYGGGGAKGYTDYPVAA